MGLREPFCYVKVIIAKILGIEFARDLISIAASNIRRYRNQRQRCRDIHALHIDVENFEIPDDNCVFYLFNPFDRELTQAFVDRAARAFERRRQKMLFILYHPRHKTVFDRSLFLKRMPTPGAVIDVFAVYESIDLNDHDVHVREG